MNVKSLKYAYTVYSRRSETGLLLVKKMVGLYFETGDLTFVVFTANLCRFIHESKILESEIYIFVVLFDDQMVVACIRC